MDAATLQVVIVAVLLGWLFLALVGVVVARFVVGRLISRVLLMIYLTAGGAYASADVVTIARVQPFYYSHSGDIPGLWVFFIGLSLLWPYFALWGLVGDY